MLVGSESSVECSLRNTACNTRAENLWIVGLKCLRPTAYKAVRHTISLFSMWLWSAPWPLVPQTVQGMNSHRQETKTSPVTQAHPIKFPGRADFTTFCHYQVLKQGFMEVWNPTYKVRAHCLTNFSQETQTKTKHLKTNSCQPAPHPSPDTPAWPPCYRGKLWGCQLFLQRNMGWDVFLPFKKGRDPSSH